MPLTETFSLGTVKQSPAPQHHSPATLRNPPRLIHESCADASEPITPNVATKPTNAIDRTDIAVPPRGNAALPPGFLEGHTVPRDQRAACQGELHGRRGVCSCPGMRARRCGKPSPEL